MRRFFLLLCIALGLALSNLPSFGSEIAEGTSVTTLANGMRVVVREKHTVKLAAVEIWFKAGSVNETPEQSGISHMIEHMLFKATSKYGPGQIDREIEGVGAELNGGTSKDWVHFYTTVASEYMPSVLDLLADAVTNPQFRTEDLDKERQVVLDEIARAESDSELRAINLFNRTAYGTHPYALPSVGMKDVIKRLTREELLSYYKKHYTPENTCVVIVGDVEKRAALKCVEKAFSSFQQPNELADSSPTVSRDQKPKVQRYKWSANESYAMLGFPAPASSDFNDVCAFDIFSVLLGDTFRGRVFQALNGAKIRYSKVSSDFLVQRYPSMIYVQVLVDPADLDKVPPIILSEFRKLTLEEISKSELAQAKGRVIGSDLYAQETFSGQANLLGLYSSIGSYDMAGDYSPTVGALRTSDLMDCARKYFSADNYTCIVVSPTKEGEGKR